MKVAASLALLASALQINAHYVFPSLVSDGTPTAEWKNVRQWTGYYSNGPVTDISSIDIRCNKDGSEGGKAETLDVTAGSSLGFTAKTSVSHPGTLQFYMAKVPEGSTAADWDGSGSVWFKVFGEGPVIGSGGLTWPSQDATTVSFDIPSSLPSGEYLVRVEHIALHSASAPGGAQFYISCGQVNVSGGGNGSPGPTVEFPGAYTETDPGLMLNIYYPVPTSYTLPGPEVWTG
ncbi:hypothetical protein FQN54_000356 [Arachnomyces sp. PD_36]|nr:hypothetical protein FQN54_000356 [Arachnomyces sp. PD_36]